MGPIQLDELAKLHHLDVANLAGRVVNLMPVWEDGEWRLWTEGLSGKLIQMKVVDAAHSNYLAKTAAAPQDTVIAFLEFMWQQASWPSVTRLLLGIADDFHLMATIAAKLEHFFLEREQIDGTRLGSFVRAEIEYLVVVARSVFDLFQEIVANVWNDGVRLVDPEKELVRAKRRLPDTFAKVIFTGGKVRSAADIAAHYALPITVAEMYAKHADFFGMLRASRDSIIHGGSSADMIFVTEKGFCVSPLSRRYTNFQWSTAHYYNSAIVSLMPWVADVVFQTIAACENIILALAATVPFPPAMAPGYHVFLRDPCNDALVRLLRAARGELVWWSDAFAELDRPPIPHPGST